MPQLAFSTGAPGQADAEVLVLPVFEGPEPGPGVKELGLAEVYADARLTGKRGQDLLVPRRADDAFVARNVLLLGMGSSAEAGPATVRRVLGKAASSLTRFASVATTVPQTGGRVPADAVQAAVEGLVLGAYRFDEFRSRTKKPAEERTTLGAVTILGPTRWNARAVRQAIGRAEIVADAVCWARDLVNTPSIVCTPDYLAKQAQKMARAEGLSVKVWGKPELEKGGFGGILGVGAGSANPPRLIELRYTGGKTARTVALTGKGISFDSGGLSLKDPKNMEWMKADMGGAASILATMKAIARLKPKINVIAAVPSSENMPSGSAIRPGDVLRHRNGVTSEVLNTDAEGRLVLADALAYLAEKKPELIIDTATLTGACMVALGADIAGAMGNDPRLVKEVLASGEAVDEPIWELPLWKDYHAQIESKVADVKNVGQRWGGAITAGLFLQEFVDGVPWVHIDIAGPAFAENSGDFWGFGGTGVPVRTLVRFLTERASSRTRR